jgi:hypothetical protein
MTEFSKEIGNDEYSMNTEIKINDTDREMLIDLINHPRLVTIEMRELMYLVSKDLEGETLT